MRVYAYDWILTIRRHCILAISQSNRDYIEKRKKQRKETAQRQTAKSYRTDIRHSGS